MIVMACCLLVVIIASFINKSIKVIRAAPGDPKSDAKYLCHSLARVTVSLSWIILTVQMCVLTFKIKRMTESLNKQMLEAA